MSARPLSTLTLPGRVRSIHRLGTEFNERGLDLDLQSLSNRALRAALPFYVLDDRDTERTLELLRLGELFTVSWAALLRGDKRLRVFDNLMAIMDLQATLTGLGLPSVEPEPVLVINPADLAREAAELRAGGRTLADIACRCDLPTPAHARSLVLHDLDEQLRDPLRAVREEMASALDALSVPLWWPAIDMPPDHRAITQLIRIIERRSRILGLFPRPPRLWDPRQQHRRRRLTSA